MVRLAVIRHATTSPLKVLAVRLKVHYCTVCLWSVCTSEKPRLVSDNLEVPYCTLLLVTTCTRQDTATPATTPDYTTWRDVMILEI